MTNPDDLTRRMAQLAAGMAYGEIIEEMQGGLKFTLVPNAEPYVPSLNEIAEYHEHQASWFPDAKDAQWHLQAAKYLRELNHE